MQTEARNTTKEAKAKRQLGENMTKHDTNASFARFKRIGTENLHSSKLPWSPNVVSPGTTTVTCYYFM